VHVHADIFGAGHKGRSSSGAVELALKTLLHQGRPFILRRLIGTWRVKIILTKENKQEKLWAGHWLHNPIIRATIVQEKKE
jgi:hypothetical protein